MIIYLSIYRSIDLSFLNLKLHYAADLVLALATDFVPKRLIVGIARKGHADQIQRGSPLLIISTGFRCATQQDVNRFFDVPVK